MFKQVKTYYSAASPLAKVAAWLLVAAVMYFVGKKIYTKFLVFTPAPLPNSDTVGVNLTPQQAQDVRRIALALHSDMDGINFTRNWDLYSEFAALNDPMFIAVYNDFGNLYYSEGKGTLRAWIEDENFTASGFLSKPFWWTAGWVKDNIIDRMDALNLQ